MTDTFITDIEGGSSVEGTFTANFQNPIFTVTLIRASSTPVNLRLSVQYRQIFQTAKTLNIGESIFVVVNGFSANNRGTFTIESDTDCTVNCSLSTLTPSGSDSFAIDFTNECHHKKENHWFVWILLLVIFFLIIYAARR